MALFNFGKKKEEKKSCCCSCGAPAQETTITNDKGKELPIVNIHYKMHSLVKEDIYDYLTM